MQIHTFRDIVLFVAAYEERSFTAAARRENGTQSGVSQHIRKLEEGFGVDLFERAGSSVVPTPAGDRYYQHCVDILRASDEATARVKDHAVGEVGNLYVGLMPTITRHCLSLPLIEIAEKNPNARITIIEGFSSDLTARLKSGYLDFAIVPLAEPQVGLRSSAFTVTPEVLACGRKSRFFGRSSIDPLELSGLSLIVPTEPNVRRSVIDGFLRENGVRPRRVLELDSMMGTLDTIRRSDYVSILPMLLVAGELRSSESHPTLSIARLGLSRLETKLVILERSRGTMGRIGQALCSALKAECLKVQEDIGDT